MVESHKYYLGGATIEFAIDDLHGVTVTLLEFGGGQVVEEGTVELFLPALRDPLAPIAGILLPDDVRFDIIGTMEDYV